MIGHWFCSMQTHTSHGLYKTHTVGYNVTCDMIAPRDISGFLCFKSDSLNLKFK